MARVLSEAEIRRIRELYAKCGNCSMVARLVGRSAVTVAKCIKRIEEEEQRSTREG